MCPGRTPEYVVGWYAAPNEKSTSVVGIVEQVTGRPARAFEQWVAEHAERFRTPDAEAPYEP